ncbi:MAG TPA: hypothetical protein ACFCUC_08980 [Desulfobacterales bacterium]
MDRKIEERQKHQLSRYYETVIHAVKNADKILIMGPGEAKIELRKQIESSMPPLSLRIFAVESCDKMTERQIVARVRSVFEKGAMSNRENASASMERV